VPEPPLPPLETADDQTPAPAPEPATVKEVPPEQSPTAAWNTYHGNPALDGIADATFPESLELRWRFVAEAPVWATPVVADDRIHFTDTQGRVYAIDFDGQPLWTKTFTRGTRKDGSPVPEVFDAPLLCADGLLIAGSADGAVYALDPATGEQRWKTDIDGIILGTPNYLSGAPGLSSPSSSSDLSDQSDPTDQSDSSPPPTPPAVRLYILEQGNGILHCLDLHTGSPVWAAEDLGRSDCHPSVGEGVVVFGSCAAALHVFSAENGEMLREIAVDEDSQMAGGVAIVTGSIYSGTRSGKVLRADVNTGDIVWLNEDSQDEVFTTPAVCDTTVVFGCADWFVYALDRETGKKLWAFDTEGRPSSAVIAGDKVVVGSDGWLLLLRLSDGESLWSHEVSDTITSPAVVGDLVIVGSDDGTVVAFGPADPKEDA
jgi:outer membrane protein assembly factor BamB